MHRLREIQTFNTTGMSRLLEGHSDEAIAVFKKGVDAYPDAPDLRLNLGLAQSQSGQHRAAIATFQELLDRKLGSDTLLHRYLAQEYSSVGEADEAMRHQAIYLRQREEELGVNPSR